MTRQHTKALEQQLIKIEQAKPRENEEAKNSRGFQNQLKERSSQKHLGDNDDNFSQASFKSAQTGFTGNTAMEEQAKISKESIIYQKYV